VKKFEDMITRFDTIHTNMTDRQTDGRTPRDGVDHAYALHRAAKKIIKIKIKKR